MMMKGIFEVDPWKVTVYKFSKEDKRLQEGITVIGSDYMRMRGKSEEGYSGDTLQGTYLAGVWFPDKTVVGWWKNGYPKYLGKTPDAPSFIGTGTTVDGKKLDLAKVKFSDFELSLDMYQGLLSRSFVYEGRDVKVEFEFECFLHIIQKEAALIKAKATVLEGHVKTDFDPTLNGTVVNEDSNYDECLWVPLGEDKDRRTIQVKIKPNPYEIPQLTVLLRQALCHNGEALRDEVSSREAKLSEETSVELDQDQSYGLEKDVITVTSRDVGEKDQADVVENLMGKLQAKSSAENLAEHTATWEKRWETGDVKIAGDAATQQGTRFNILQLFMTYYGRDERLNVGSKGFTGEKYSGATCQDTEAFIVLMYLAITRPSVTKALLGYRHSQLPGAYRNTKEQGLPGALFPMVTFSGIEYHNEQEITFEEIH